MAAELHLAEDALALHLLLQHFEGFVRTLLSRTRTCMRRPLDRTVDGPGSERTDGQGARATGARICRMRVPTAPAVRTDADFEIVPAGGTRATYRKKRRLRHVAVFWAAHEQADTCLFFFWVPEVKNNRSRAVINGLSADGVGDHDSN